MGNGVIVFLAIIASSLILGSYAGAENEEEKINVVGKVLCQDCTEGWTEWVIPPKPIEGAKVSVRCFGGGQRELYFATHLTDNVGTFDCIFNKLQDNELVDPSLCEVKLVESPDPICYIASDFGGGKSGVRLRRPTEVTNGIEKYVVGPFYFTTPMCDALDSGGN